MAVTADESMYSGGDHEDAGAATCSPKRASLGIALCSRAFMGFPCPKNAAGMAGRSPLTSRATSYPRLPMQSHHLGGVGIGEHQNLFCPPRASPFSVPPVGLNHGSTLSRRLRSRRNWSGTERVPAELVDDASTGSKAQPELNAVIRPRFDERDAKPPGSCPTAVPGVPIGSRTCCARR